METIDILLLSAAFAAGWMLSDSIRQLLKRIKRPINLTCTLFGHDMRGPFPIGEPGEMRFICPRCYKLMILDPSRNVTIYHSAEFMDDPLVNLIRKIKSYR
jgi:hypothetical protein